MWAHIPVKCQFLVPCVMAVSQRLRCLIMLECCNFFHQLALSLSLSLSFYFYCLFFVTNWTHDLPHFAELQYSFMGTQSCRFSWEDLQMHCFKFPCLWRILLWILVEELYVTCHRTIIKLFEQIEIHWLLYLLYCVCCLCE